MPIKLKELRDKIDRLDSELISLLKHRFELALMTKKLKPSVSDPEREAKIIERVRARALALGLLAPDFVEKIFKLNISESKKLQNETHLLAGFQGEYGAYSEIASSTFDKDLAPISFEDFSDVFENVEKGYLDLGVVPVENTIGGSIAQVNDLLIETELKVIGEVKLPIHHSLLALPGTDYKDIKTVYSHPQALSQCRSFLNRNKLEARSYYDTAGAARMLAADRPEASAVIASTRCAELYELEIIKEYIEDHKQNYTRFLVLAREEKTPDLGLAAKCSVIFSLPDRAGALFDALKLFADAKINLTRIESMPRRDEPGAYWFFMDCNANIQDKKVALVLENLKSASTKYKFLGCYGV
jgi:prephenate dehydratase/chorismate mutase/prephenate dehydratase